MTDEHPRPVARGEASARAGVSVVHVDPRLYEDGASRMTIRLVHRWRATGVPVVFYVLQRAKPGNAAPVPPDLRITYPTRRNRRLREVVPVALWQLVRLARRADVVVSAREIGWGLLVAWAAARVARRPYVIVVQAAPQEAIRRWMDPRLHALVHRIYRSADRLVCVAPGLVPAVLEMGVRPERAAVALNGLEVDRVVEAAQRPARGLPEGDGPLVVGLGRLEAQKGFDVLIRAHAQVVAAGHPHRLLVLGEGGDRASLEQLAAYLGVAGSVHLPGFTAEPLPVLAAADLFVLPSRYEGFGQSLAEALVLGVPSIAADCVSGPRLLLADGAHGDLVPVEDVDALAAAVQRHLEDPRRLREAAERGRVWAVEHLRAERAADDVLGILRDVAAQARRPATRTALRTGAAGPGPAGSRRAT